ncbi:hypothetical protein M8J77_016019 [Diaphorina citri]|nr:hypothetical protein M8J77_016019 [Diaphorina citri]
MVRRQHHVTSESELRAEECLAPPLLIINIQLDPDLNCVEISDEKPRDEHRTMLTHSFLTGQSKRNYASPDKQPPWPKGGLIKILTARRAANRAGPVAKFWQLRAEFPVDFLAIVLNLV